MQKIVVPLPDGCTLEATTHPLDYLNQVTPYGIYVCRKNKEGKILEDVLVEFNADENRTQVMAWDSTDIEGDPVIDEYLAEAK